MHALQFFLSPAGRLRPRVFVLGALTIYAVGAVSQYLTAPGILLRAGLWPFAMLQAALIWAWFVLHAKRLRDTGRGIGLAVGASGFYALSVVLLLIVAGAVLHTSTIAGADVNAASALGLILLVAIITILFTSPHYDFSPAIVGLLTAMALAPIVMAAATTLWAATRSSSEECEG